MTTFVGLEFGIISIANRNRIIQPIMAQSEATTSSQNSYLDTLNPIQRAAVMHMEGPILVVAGPGSGKTRVLTFRIAYLIQQGVAPWNILALTFTNKAAREMKSRIEQVIGQNTNQVWAGTFHSIFAKILRVEAEHIGYPSNFTIYDTDDTKSVIKSIIKELNLNKDLYNINTIKNRISNLKSNLITPKAYADMADQLTNDNILKMPKFSDIYAKYTIKCKRAGAMDFDDLLYRLYELLQNKPEIRIKYQDKFKYVLVDEFQDTNVLQYAIIRKLLDYRKDDNTRDLDKSPNICVVGDDAQSIYAFRGATIQNILDYEKDFKPFGIKTYKLEQNYRSTNHIVETANEIISQNKNQIKKKIWSDKGEGAKIKVIKAKSDQEEGKRVVDTIVEFKARNHLSNSDFAILYRTNAQSRIFEEYLRRFNVPYKVFGGLSFYQRKEIKDLVAYLRVAINPNDDEALKRMINYPKRGIGQATIDKISQFADSQNTTMYQVLNQVPLSKRPKTLVTGFKKLIDSFVQLAQKVDAYEASVQIAKRSKLVDVLRQDLTIEGINRLDNLQSLLDGIKEFTQNPPDANITPDLSAYIQNIALLTDQDSNDVNNKDFVTLMSVHAAKGLEFPAIFVVGMEEQLFPSFMSMETPEQMEEERRLFYVAITRAERFLTLSYSDVRYKFGQMRYNRPSRFLEEIRQNHLDIDGVRGRTNAHKTNRMTQASGVTGITKNRLSSKKESLKGEPKDFKPSPASTIKKGQSVFHLRFGKGVVQAIEGSTDNPVATIHFSEIDNPKRRILLKYGKLQIVESSKK